MQEMIREIQNLVEILYFWFLSKTGMVYPISESKICGFCRLAINLICNNGCFLIVH